MNWTLFFALLEFLVLVLGFVLIAFNGWRRNLVFLFSWMLISIYYFVTPLYFYLNDRRTIWGNNDMEGLVGEDIYDFYVYGFAYFSLANLVFLLGYFIIKQPKAFVIQRFNFRNTNLIVSLFVLFFTIVVFNFYIDGINIIEVLTGSSENVIAGKSGGSNYLKNLSDSIITTILLAYIYRVDRRFFIIMLVLSIGLFLLMGFRYRIILIILGIGLYRLYELRSFRFLRMGTITVGILVLYIILFITVNRQNFIYSNYSSVQYNPINYPVVSLLAEQTRGALDDINIIKYYKTNSNPQYDHGVTFLYFIVRAMPRSIFGEWKDKMYPPPAFSIIYEAYNLPVSWGNTGEAPLPYSYFLIAGGFWFLVVGAFVVGLLLRIITLNRDCDLIQDRVFLIIICLALFMWLTRGYFPQFVDHLVFLLIPYLIYYSVSNKANV
ncbi:MAG: hypothetical protein IT267_11415 [Saprospiraceae bacterium]|nr:hypothetical protein [Saprospiraceae bacterium]